SIAGLDSWEIAGPPTARCTQTVHCDPGCYVFRVLSNTELGTSDPGPVSERINVTDDICHAQSGVVLWRKDFLDHYLEVAECGRGRFSTVKKCVHNKTGDRVAAKMISGQYQPCSVVEHECLILRGLHHRGLLELLECYRTSTGCILVFPFVDGLRLFEHICLRWASYSEHSICIYIRQLLNALDYLHMHGIAHLDIKVRFFFSYC
ncbi:unnamed protein product, partial [Ixodes persulcatus]